MYIGTVYASESITMHCNVAMSLQVYLLNVYKYTQINDKKCTLACSSMSLQLCMLNVGTKHVLIKADTRIANTLIKVSLNLPVMQ